LAINSHQPIEGILSWYEAHVCSEEGWNMHGSLFHGGISIFHGTNENLAWAHTTGDLDMADVYHLEMHPRKKKWYKFDGEWHKLETHRAKLKVGLGKKRMFASTSPRNIGGVNMDQRSSPKSMAHFRFACLHCLNWGQPNSGIG
jgi:acyl-homoserine lactone acylase PvdQ